jgi:hypothetical protein
MGQNRLVGGEIGNARVSQLSHPGHFDPIDNLGNQMADFESRKKPIVYSSIALTMVLLLWLIVVSS